MQRQITIVLAAVLLSVLAMAATPKKVLVTKLKAQNVAASVVPTMDTGLCNAVTADKRYEAVCPDVVENVMAADSMNGMLGGESACAGDSCAEMLAKRVKANLMITGSLGGLGKDKYVLTLELVDTATAKSLARVEEKVNGGTDKVYERIPGAVKKLLGKANSK
jgi:hypothetical protein